MSPQFHVVFDDYFTTVLHLRKGTVPKNWELLVQNSRERSTDEFYDLTKTWFQATQDKTAEDLENVHLGSTPGVDDASEGPTVSATDDTVKISNISVPDTAVSEGGVATHANEGNTPLVSEELDKDHAVSPEFRGRRL